MNALEDIAISVHPRVTGPLPGPCSAELLARQDRREPDARVYPRHIPIAVEMFQGNQLAFAAGAQAVRIVRRDDLAACVRAEALADGQIVELGGDDWR
jgi:hypothetical protein